MVLFHFFLKINMYWRSRARSGGLLPGGKALSVDKVFFCGRAYFFFENGFWPRRKMLSNHPKGQEPPFFFFPCSSPPSTAQLMCLFFIIQPAALQKANELFLFLVQPLKIFQSEKELTQPTVHIIYSEVVQKRVPDVTKTNPNKYREHQLQASLYSPIYLFPFLEIVSHARGHCVGFQIYWAFIIVTSVLTSFIGHTIPFHVMFLESQLTLWEGVFKACFL